MQPVYSMRIYVHMCVHKCLHKWLNVYTGSSKTQGRHGLFGWMMMRGNHIPVRTNTLVRQADRWLAPHSICQRPHPGQAKFVGPSRSHHPPAAAHSPNSHGHDDRLPTISASHIWNLGMAAGGRTVNLSLNFRSQKLCNMMSVNCTQLAPVYKPDQSVFVFSSSF